MNPISVISSPSGPDIVSAFKGMPHLLLSLQRDNFIYGAQFAGVMYAPNGWERKASQFNSEMSLALLLETEERAQPWSAIVHRVQDRYNIPDVISRTGIKMIMDTKYIPGGLVEEMDVKPPKTKSTRGYRLTKLGAKVAHPIAMHTIKTFADMECSIEDVLSTGSVNGKASATEKRLKFLLYLYNKHKHVTSKEVCVALGLDKSAFKPAYLDPMCKTGLITYDSVNYKEGETNNYWWLRSPVTHGLEMEDGKYTNLPVEDKEPRAVTHDVALIMSLYGKMDAASLAKKIGGKYTREHVSRALAYLHRHGYVRPDKWHFGRRSTLSMSHKGKDFIRNWWLPIRETLTQEAPTPELLASAQVFLNDSRGVFDAHVAECIDRD